MQATNLIRIGITFFIVVLIAISLSGWMWTASHQPPGQSVASRIVLGLCIVAGLVGLVALWRGRPTR